MSYPIDPEVGWYYVVSVAGEVEGVQYEVGDWIVWNGTGWDRIAGNRIINLNQILTRAHADLQGIGVNDHHSQVVNLNQITTRVHADLQSIGASDHHAKTVASELGHNDLGGIGTDDHHTKLHGNEVHTGTFNFLLYKGVWDVSGG